MIEVPDLHRYTGRLKGLGLFICGMVVGGAVYMSIHQHNFNMLYEQYQDALKEKMNLTDEINTLSKYKNRQTIISKVNVKVISAPGQPPLDEILENEIELRVRNALKVYIGKSVSKLASFEDQDIARGLVNKRYYVLDKDYVIDVKSFVLIHSELTAWVAVQPFIPPK